MSKEIPGGLCGLPGITRKMVKRELNHMGIKIELTDDNLPEVAQEIEIREDEVANLMKNQQAECDGMLGDACLMLETHEDGSVISRKTGIYLSSLRERSRRFLRTHHSSYPTFTHISAEPVLGMDFKRR